MATLLTKSEAAEVQKAVNFARIDPRFAAASLAGVMRSCRRKSAFAYMSTVMYEHGLREHMEVVNGCYVAKVAA